MEKYLNRKEAGQILATKLGVYQNQENTIVLALPRGGVPVAFEIATALNLPLDLYIVRKLGVPWHSELAMGAIGSGDVIFFNEALLEGLSLSQKDIDKVIDEERKELKRRELMYRGNKPFPNLKDKTVIVVDDGIATGATLRVVIKALSQQHLKKLLIAVPVAAASTCKEIKAMVDDIICPLTPSDFYAVGLWYEIFDQTTDEEVFHLLNQANTRLTY